MDVRILRHSQRASITREQAVERIEQRHISTFDLLEPAEVARGMHHALEELPPTVEYPPEWLVAVAITRRLPSSWCWGLARASRPSAARAQAQQLHVRAKVTFVKRDFEFRQVRLSITRNGKTWRSGRLGTTYFRPPTVRVRDLDRDGELDVVVDTSTGGAHCCLQSRFFRHLPDRGVYAGTFHDWGNGGYRLKNLDGQAESALVSGDDRRLRVHGPARPRPSL